MKWQLGMKASKTKPETLHWLTDNMQAEAVILITQDVTSMHAAQVTQGCIFKLWCQPPSQILQHIAGPHDFCCRQLNFKK